jgi:hypothetical protein
LKTSLRVWILLGCLLISACAKAGPSSSPLPPGLSEDAARAAAATHLGNGAIFVSAAAGPFGTTYHRNSNEQGADLGVADTTWVWVMQFAVVVEICPPLAMATCEPPRPGTATVVLDYVTGAFDFSGVVAPAPART